MSFFQPKSSDFVFLVRFEKSLVDKIVIFIMKLNLSWVDSRFVAPKKSDYILHIGSYIN